MIVSIEELFSELTNLLFIFAMGSTARRTDQCTSTPFTKDDINFLHLNLDLIRRFGLETTELTIGALLG
jgi:hypothetical protein